ncbi:MAG: M24 family metallopeptidase [Nitrospirae bacterium]|nr:MAG: M24 family metallopeptidase [Nitrospirota bacterium]
MTDRISSIQQALREAGLDGWLFYDFRGSDPLAARILKIDPARHMTRRWYYLIPARGTAIKILHKIEPHSLDDVPGETHLYLSWQEQHEHLRQALATIARSPRGPGASESASDARAPAKVAMQYSPMNAVPYVSRVDAGTLELVRSLGAEVVTSADLVQRFEAVWTADQYASHCEAASALRQIVDEVFAGIGRDIRKGHTVTERDVQKNILAGIEHRGMFTYSPPIVAVNAHAADPHYSPPVEGSSILQRGDLVLIDLWAKNKTPGSMYGDITWTGFIGDQVPARQAEVFAIVAAARDAAVLFVREEVSSGRFPRGGDVDDVCRNVIRKAGYADRFIHRTGHSIGEEVHGNGANIDNLETNDARRLLPRTCFSIEPGIYLPGEFGIRSEVDVYLTEREAIVTGLPIQTEIVPILA